MEKLQSFFWYCSGANTELLNQCPTDSSKYVGIGATILFTGLFAALSAAYAFFTVFDSYLIASILGFVWGLMIFNLDRFIVTSMRKTSKKEEFVMAIPRLILAILISIVIAKPLELKIFEKEINSELLVMQDEMKAAQKEKIIEDYAQQKSTVNQELSDLKTEIRVKEQERNELRDIARQEADGTGGTMKRNPGPIYQIKKANADQVEGELQQLIQQNNPIIANKISQIKQLDSLQAAALLAIDIKDIGGPAARLEALDRLATKSSAIWWANAFIVLLFIVIETSPIFVKLISKKGPYDHLLFHEEYKFETGAYKNKAFIHHELKKESASLAAKEKEFVTNRLDVDLDKA
ncbi:hypothetical protein MATR_32390 [Marivirga tractuosa]|uniref:DUF4407 domain-containing protein n=1 Tax=Marivirga tractuosa (strain ATCC 23168 / DSM 4126 / NBRC 15989 / NCIMB 1408 / VKM B-1430 / H-43) TaxID=643867 RepID=E4TSX1_MARTH|nr:DUF4407 domain-containing protein [Marivirga tractuosa]ADR22912.1 hypothetical protein Ftrac_2936 [Marivirga tractuosa DSM 4126]BDD16414.1 hypothetical protein MATR_32390 [Marivirga tractuosa]